MRDDLNIQQRKFVTEYLKTGNAKQSAIAAGYSEKTAEVTGSRLLRNVKVKAALVKPIEKAIEKTQLTAERIIQEMCRVAFLDIRKLFDENGQLRPVTELDDDTAAAIMGIDIDEIFDGRGNNRKKIGYSRKVRTVSKMDALSKLLDHLKPKDDDQKKDVFNLTINLSETPARQPGDNAKIINQEATEIPRINL